MRRFVLILGVALLAAGLLAAYFPGPVAAVPGGVQPVSPQTPVTVGGLPLAFLTPSISWRASWPATNVSDGVTVYLFACGRDASCSGLDLTNDTPVQQVDGSTGALSWSGGAGEYFALFSTSPVNMSFEYQAPLFGGLLGLILIGVGAAVAILGALVRAPAPPERREPSA